MDLYLYVFSRTYFRLQKQIKAARLRGPPLPKAPNDSMYPAWDWPEEQYKIRLGQVAGVAVDPDDTPVLFHRGNRTYNRL